MFAQKAVPPKLSCRCYVDVW